MRVKCKLINGETIDYRPKHLILKTSDQGEVVSTEVVDTVSAFDNLRIRLDDNILNNYVFGGDSITNTDITFNKELGTYRYILPASGEKDIDGNDVPKFDEIHWFYTYREKSYGGKIVMDPGEQNENTRYAIRKSIDWDSYICDKMVETDFYCIDDAKIGYALPWDAIDEMRAPIGREKEVRRWRSKGRRCPKLRRFPKLRQLHRPLAAESA